MTRWTMAEVMRANLNIQAAAHAPLTKMGQRVPKYRNSPTVHAGQRFDSQRECEAWKNFELQRIAGGIRAVISQVSMRLPGTTRRIRIDFMVVENDGRIQWYDAKGFETEAWNLKRKQVFDAYGISIQLI